MSELKKIDMSAFIGRDFDCVNKISHSQFIGHLKGYCEEIKSYILFSYGDYNAPCDHVMPRINKPQVLDDYSWVPDGLIWKLRLVNYASDSQSYISTKFLKSEHVIIYAMSRMHRIESLSCLGLEKGYEHEGMEVL